MIRKGQGKLPPEPQPDFDYGDFSSPHPTSSTITTIHLLPPQLQPLAITNITRTPDTMARTKRTPTRTRTPPITCTEIPMGAPIREAPSGKTLIDIIDSHRPRDASGAPIPSSSTPTEGEEEIFGPGMQAFCLTVPFCMLLGTFDYLVHLQYRQEVDLNGIIWKVI